MSDIVYDEVIGKSGSRWLIPSNIPNKADHIHVEGGEGSQGYGGSEVNFTLSDGSTLALKGPWHANPKALFNDTGLDISHLHHGKLTIGEEWEGDKPIKVVYQDEDWVLGGFIWEEGKRIAQEICNERQEELVYLCVSSGGSCGGSVKPKTRVI
jgi:hypothetical protein